MATSSRVSTRQYNRLVAGWVNLVGLNPSTDGTQSLRRTKESLVYKQQAPPNMRRASSFAAAPPAAFSINSAAKAPRLTRKIRVTTGAVK